MPMHRCARCSLAGRQGIAIYHDESETCPRSQADRGETVWPPAAEPPRDLLWPDGDPRNRETLRPDQLEAASLVAAGHPGGGAQGITPIPMKLYCPECTRRHWDRGVWATRPHRTHRCSECGHHWRPFDYPTVGIPRVRDEGLEDAAAFLSEKHPHWREELDELCRWVGNRVPIVGAPGFAAGARMHRIVLALRAKLTR